MSSHTTVFASSSSRVLQKMPRCSMIGARHSRDPLTRAFALAQDDALKKVTVFPDTSYAHSEFLRKALNPCPDIGLESAVLTLYCTLPLEWVSSIAATQSTAVMAFSFKLSAAAHSQKAFLRCPVLSARTFNKTSSCPATFTLLGSSPPAAVSAICSPEKTSLKFFSDISRSSSM